MEIYFDNAATTKPSEAALAEFNRVSTECFGNPASLHMKGLAAEKVITAASKTIAGLIGAKPDEIFYTSGGTESNNLAIFGAMKPFRAARRLNAVTTAAEHPSVLECFATLENMGFETTVVPVDKGIVDIDGLIECINENTRLVSVSYVNNETGAITDIERLGGLIKSKNPSALFHVDAVQAFGKYKINTAKSKIDLLSLSAHKVHGLKGTGALYIRNGIVLDPIIHGGGQQKNIRPGTENPSGAAAFATAAEECYNQLDSAFANAVMIKNVLNGVANQLTDVFINSGEESSPFITNVSFMGVRAEVLLHALEASGITASAGSACSSKDKLNKALAKMGFDKTRAESAVRFSTSRFNTVNEAEFVVEKLVECVPVLRKYGGLKG